MFNDPNTNASKFVLFVVGYGYAFGTLGTYISAICKYKIKMVLTSQELDKQRENIISRMLANAFATMQGCIWCAVCVPLEYVYLDSLIAAQIVS